MWKRLRANYPLFLSDLKQTSTFSPYFQKRLKYQISSKSVQWEPNCSKRTDIAKLIVAFPNSGNPPKNMSQVEPTCSVELILHTVHMRNESVRTAVYSRSLGVKKNRLELNPSKHMAPSLRNDPNCLHVYSV